MDWKKIWKRVLFPHPAALGVIVVLAAAMLICSFLYLEETDAGSIVSYALSAYALAIVCLRVPDMTAWIRRLRAENRYILRYSGDLRLRMSIQLYGGGIWNAVYALFQLGLGLAHRSVWFYAMAGYYLLLAIMRLTLLRHTRRHAPGAQQEAEWRNYRLCGICLLVMNLALAIMIVYFVWKIRVFRHHEITTIAMAAFTFASMTMAIVNMVRGRRTDSPVCAAVRSISLISAAVSMLTLENSMLTVFGGHDSELFHRLMLGATGTAVIFLVQGIAIYMIVRARNNLMGGVKDSAEGTNRAGDSASAQ